MQGSACLKILKPCPELRELPEAGQHLLITFRKQWELFLSGVTTLKMLFLKVLFFKRCHCNPTAVLWPLCISPGET